MATRSSNPPVGLNFILPFPVLFWGGKIKPVFLKQEASLDSLEQTAKFADFGVILGTKQTQECLPNSLPIQMDGSIFDCKQ